MIIAVESDIEFYFYLRAQVGLLRHETIATI